MKRKAIITCGSKGIHKTELLKSIITQNPYSVVVCVEEERQKLEQELGRKPKTAELEEVLESILEGAFIAVKTVILDAAHSKRAQRRESLSLLQRYGYDSVTCYFSTPTNEDEFTEADRQLLKNPPEAKEGFFVANMPPTPPINKSCQSTKTMHS